MIKHGFALGRMRHITLREISLRRNLVDDHLMGRMNIIRRQDLVSKAWRYLPSEKRVIVGLAALAVLAAQAESAALVLIALTADVVARGNDSLEVSAGPIAFDLPAVTAVGIGLGAIVVAAIVGYVYGRLAAHRSARLEREGRDSIVTSYANASWEFQSTQKSSRLQARLLRLMDARSYAFLGMVRWARALATIAVFITVAAVMSFIGALVIVVFGGLLSLAVYPIRRRIGRLADITTKQEVSVASDFAEAIDHGADVRVFGAWPAFEARFSKRSQELESVRSRLATSSALMPVVYQYGALTLILLVLLVAIGASSQGQFGQFAASALLLLRSVQYGQQLQSSLQNLAESIPRIELLDAELVTPPPKVVPGDVELDRIADLELQDVVYTYPGGDGPALAKASIRLRPGIIFGIAGPSGSGKSTLAQILLRIRWPDSGHFLLNGRTAAVYTAESWNRFVSHVPQHPLLLHGTLLENVTFLDQRISREMAFEALTKVGLTELVDTLPGGLDSPVGPTERNLSGGQVQRLGIARALARHPQLVVLDEPTSALDVDAERVVGEALDTLRNQPDVLVVVIAHRPSTLALCDEIIVLEEGRVETTGTPERVTQKSGFLSRTWGSNGDGEILDGG